MRALERLLVQALASPEGDVPARSPLFPVTEAELAARQIREGQELEIPRRQACAVAFLRNEERNVFFAMHGLPETVPGEEQPRADAIVRSVPQVLLADPGTRMSSGEAPHPAPPASHSALPSRGRSCSVRHPPPIYVG